MSTKIIIAGGTGFLGSILIDRYKLVYDEIIVLSRHPKAPKENIRYVEWDAKTLGDWVNELEGSVAVLNFVGRSVNCRYTEANKKEIISSRVEATQAIGKAILLAKNPPLAWVNAGSAAIFGNSGDVVKDEFSSLGEGFSPEVCKLWEAAFNEFTTPYTRKVFLRIGLVLQPGKGLIIPFVHMVKWGLGGPMGTGKQYISWIHETDFVRIASLAIQSPEVSGILHCTSPFPVTNAKFLSTIRKRLKIPVSLPNPAFLIRIGAICIGTEADLVLDGRRVVSKLLQDNDFVFEFPTIEQTVQSIL